ncbi:NAD(P)/FAD-dependent oxidoreductase [Afifella sp. YEN Y35]|uniref:FAD/NAD(P)-dependent oxidoreductase n=1 Tax=Afifella sp. YEN Y35 TaxID=3388337 RepID=UPI0039E1FDDB
MSGAPQDAPPVIVGAGPAGLAAAGAFVEAGIRPIVLDESDRPGGQGTRRLTPLLRDKAEPLFGARAARRRQEREAREDHILSGCDYRANTLVWGAFDGGLELLSGGACQELRYAQLLLATGATDAILPLPGWTLPGVYSLGGAQVALKRHGNFIGRKIVFAGSSPLLYLAAAQYCRLGLCEITVLDTTPFRGKLRAAVGMARHAAGTLRQGLSLMAELRRAGIRILAAADLLAVEGKDRVEAFRFCDAAGREDRLDCDAVAIGFGLRPETQLAELAGAAFEFDPVLRHWFPRLSPDGQAGPALWIAGDGARTMGAEGASFAGRLAALSMLQEMGRGDAVKPDEMRRLRRRLEHARRFQLAAAEAFRIPREMLSRLPEDTILCRCERVTLGEVRSAVPRASGPVEVNRNKAITRCGMGRCQGRYCGVALGEVVAKVTERDLAEVGRLRAQAPIRPIPMSAAMRDAAE